VSFLFCSSRNDTRGPSRGERGGPRESFLEEQSEKTPEVFYNVAFVRGMSVPHQVGANRSIVSKLAAFYLRAVGFPQSFPQILCATV
jgi:hypothetical protein